MAEVTIDLRITRRKVNAASKIRETHMNGEVLSK